MKSMTSYEFNDKIIAMGMEYHIDSNMIRIKYKDSRVYRISINDISLCNVFIYNTYSDIIDTIKCHIN